MTFSIPSTNTLITQLVNDYIQITSSQGFLVNPDPNSEVYARLATFAGATAVTLYLFQNELEQRLVDTATGNNLDRLGNNRNIFRKAASGSSGQLLLSITSPTTINAGSILVGPNSLQYQTTTTAVYGNGPVPISSVSVGSNTNLDAGAVLEWNNIPYGAQPTAPVYTVLTGGQDTESDDTFRARIIAIIQFPPQAGNASQIQDICNNVDPIVQSAFIYSNFNGAGTALIALSGNQTGSYVGRDIPHLPLDNYVMGQIQAGLVLDSGAGTGVVGTGRPYNYYSYLTPSFDYLVLKNVGPNLQQDTSNIFQQMPFNLGNQYACAVTTLNMIPTGISISMTLPYPAGQVNNGSSAGWLNNTTWPNPDGVQVQNFCAITSAPTNGGLTITVNAATPDMLPGCVQPIAGVTKICWINRSAPQSNGWVPVVATVASFENLTNNVWSLTLDTPLVFPSGFTDFYLNTGAVQGDWIMPASIGIVTYLNQIMNQYAGLGPGQVTSNAGLQSIGAVRFPSSAANYPQVIDTRFVTPLIKLNSEVEDAVITLSAADQRAVFLINGTIGSAFGTVLSNIFNTPPVSSAPPNIFIPVLISIYDQNQVNYAL